MEKLLSTLTTIQTMGHKLNIYVAMEREKEQLGYKFQD